MVKEDQDPLEQLAGDGNPAAQRKLALRRTDEKLARLSMLSREFDAGDTGIIDVLAWRVTLLRQRRAILVDGVSAQ